MKKGRLLITIMIILLAIQPTAAMAQDKTVKVTLPSFAVTINGEQIDNAYSQYPLLVYKDITYFPMTYHGARFLHLKVNWYDTEQGKTLFVGYSEEAEQEWVSYPSEVENKSFYTAVIPDYQIAVNTLNQQEFIDNTAEEYPVLNFRGVTYFPLTWRFAVNEFGWDYHFSHEEGLQINSTEQLRPELEDEDYFSSTMPIRALGIKEYVYNSAKTTYVGYPYTNLAGATFVYHEQGKEKIFQVAEKWFSDGEYYFNRELNENGVKVEAANSPTLEKGVLSIQAVRMNHDGEENVSLKIDFNNI